MFVFIMKSIVAAWLTLSGADCVEATKNPTHPNPQEGIVCPVEPGWMSDYNRDRRR